MTKICPHRGFPIPAGQKTCPYHGLEMPCSKASFGGPAPFSIGPFEEETFQNHLDELGPCFQTIETRIEAPVYFWMQNTCDWRHVPFVHGKGFYDQFENRPPFDVQISSDNKRSSHKLWVRQHVYESFVRFVGKEFARPWFMHALRWPSYSITSFCGALYSVETAQERAPTDNTIVTRFYTRRGAKVPGALIEKARAANRQILEEDRLLINRWVDGYEQCAHRLWLPGEERIRAYVSVDSRNG